MELADKKIKEKLSDEKHELESCPKKGYFTNIFSWMRKKNKNSTLKYLKLTIIQNKDWMILLVRMLHYNKTVIK